MNNKSTLLKNKISQFSKNENSMLPQKTILNNRYIIEKPIFKNENFISYLALDNVINSEIIVKELFPKSLVTRNSNDSSVYFDSSKAKIFEITKQNFIQIFKVLQKFRANPNTIKIFTSFCERNTLYCIQEIPVGLSLKKFLSNNYGELNWEKSKDMFLNLMRFMQNLHSYDIVHCGLSPETILINNDNIKIIDFSNSIYGSNKCFLPQKLHDGYAPVEQYNSNLKIGTFTDVYSVAAIIYKSLTGTKPVSSTSRLSNDNLIPPKNLNPNVPKNVSVSIMSALISSSKMRTQTMSDFCDDLVAKSRDYYKTHQKKPEIRQHINTIEPIEKHKSKAKKQMKTRNIIFSAMLFSSSIVLFSAATVILFFLYF